MDDYQVAWFHVSVHQSKHIEYGETSDCLINIAVDLLGNKGFLQLVQVLEIVESHVLLNGNVAKYFIVGLRTTSHLSDLLNFDDVLSVVGKSRQCIERLQPLHELGLVFVSILIEVRLHYQILI